MNRRLELVIEKDRPELVMNRRLEYALPFFHHLRIREEEYTVKIYIFKKKLPIATVKKIDIQLQALSSFL